jgi:hypothetical protein
MARRDAHLRTIGCCLALVAGAARASVADGGNTAIVGYTSQFGNVLNANGVLGTYGTNVPDVSYLHSGMLRTPTGGLYDAPLIGPDARPLSPGSDWTFDGIVQAGWQSVRGDRNALFFQRYAAWTTGPVLGLLDLRFDNRNTGSYAELSASRVSSDNQYVQVKGGSYGQYRFAAFYRDMPYVQVTDARPIWQGIGTDHLTLPASLSPGASTPAQLAAATTAADRRTIQATRSSAGLSYEGALYRNWVGAAAVTNEKRDGTQLWGGSMFFNEAMETVRPVDSSTTNVNLSVRNVGKVWRFLATYQGSFFRDNKDYLAYDSPFTLANFSGARLANPVYQGQFSLEPDNDYHNLRLDLSRALRWNGNLDLSAAWGTMRQNDSLYPPTNCTGTIGVGVYAIPCADWNTTAALSQTSAHARIDTSLINAKLSFHPTSNFGWHTSFRWYREDNKTRYLAYNPLTGQYGYIADNGSQGSAVSGETGIFQPGNPLYDETGTIPIRNIPYGYVDKVVELGGDWQLGRRSHLGLTYTFDDNRPKYRERSWIDNQSLQLDWSTRFNGGPTMRMSYTHAVRTGSRYNYDPYGKFYSASLPGYVDPALGEAAFTTSAMRMYDLSDRTENKVKAIVSYPIGLAMTVSGTVHGQWDHYDTLIGRTGTRSSGANLQWQWQVSRKTSFDAYAGIGTTHTNVSNVNDADSADNGNALGTAAQTDPTLGSPLFPYANQWWQYDRERDYNGGLNFSHEFPRFRLDLSYSYTYSSSNDDYTYASTGALLTRSAAGVAEAGSGFPRNIYKLSVIGAAMDIPLRPGMGLRLYGRYEMGRFSDWHYAGFDSAGLAVAPLLYTDVGPEQHYNASVVGLMLTMKL